MYFEGLGTCAKKGRSAQRNYCWSRPNLDLRLLAVPRAAMPSSLSARSSPDLSFSLAASGRKGNICFLTRSLLWSCFMLLLLV